MTAPARPPQSAPEPPKRKPGGQPGNRNARSHGGYSTADRADLSTLAGRAREAMDRGDYLALRRLARVFRDRGYHSQAYIMRLGADQLEADAYRRAGKIPPQRRRSFPISAGPLVSRHLLPALRPAAEAERA